MDDYLAVRRNQMIAGHVRTVQLHRPIEPRIEVRRGGISVLQNPRAPRQCYEGFKRWQIGGCVDPVIGSRWSSDPQKYLAIGQPLNMGDFGRGLA
jgi:hypothetical protein